MTESDPLTTQQRQRLAVLYATQEALRLELDAFDLVSCAHWVATGRHAPAVEDAPGGTPDAARWSPKVVET